MFRRPHIILLAGITVVLLFTAVGWYWALPFALPAGSPRPRSAQPFGVDLPLVGTAVAIIAVSAVTTVLLGRDRHAFMAALVLFVTLSCLLYLGSWWALGLAGVFI